MTIPFVSCSKCGFQAAAGTKFCPNCGGTMAAPPMAASAAASSGLGGYVPPPPFQAATLLCSGCGNEFSAGTKFCPNCGAMAGAAPSRQAEYNPPPPGTRAYSPPSMALPLLCGRCGSQVAAGTNFCPHCGNSAGAAPIAADEGRYAGFGIRLLADMIDTIVLVVVFFLFSWLPIANIFISVMVTCLYGARTESSAQQASLGKRALGLKVTDLEGNRLSFGGALWRWIVKEILTITVIGWLGFFAIAFYKRSRAHIDSDGRYQGCLANDQSAQFFRGVPQPCRIRCWIFVRECAGGELAKVGASRGQRISSGGSECGPLVIGACLFERGLAPRWYPTKLSGVGDTAGSRNGARR